jgi:TetR/AcrR family transcriptional regulator, cholesterol catabolism regulator
VSRSPATDSAALVNAAALVFKSKGYHNATIDDIADAAGISRPTVYKYAQSKRALLDSMVDAVLDAISARLHEVLATTDPPADKLRRLIAIHVETATSMQTFYAILFSEETELSDEARTRFRSFSHAVAVDFQALLEDCVAAGAPAQGVDTWIAANLVLSMLTSLYRWYDSTGPTTPQQLEFQIAAVLGALTPPP